MKTGFFINLLIVCFLILGSANGIFAQDDDLSGNVSVLGDAEFLIGEADLFQKPAKINSSSEDLTIFLKDVLITDGQVSFTLAYETSASASGNETFSEALFLNGQAQSEEQNKGFEPGSEIRTETYTWNDEIPAKPGMDWESLRISFDDVFFTLGSGDEPSYIIPAEGYNLSFVFHNPETNSENTKQLASTVDERGIHTFGDHFELSLGRGNISIGADDVGYYTFDVITQSSLLNHYSYQQNYWNNGVGYSGNSQSIAIEGMNDPDAKFMKTDSFSYRVPKTLSESDVNLSIWAKQVTIELSFCGESIDPVNRWVWDGDILNSAGEKTYPVKLALFNQFTARLPQPYDPALFSDTAGDVTIDLTGFDLVSISQARLWGNPNETGFSTFLRVDICYPLPDDGEWTILPSSFLVGDTELRNPSGQPGGIIRADSETSGRQCSRLLFPVDDIALDADAPAVLSFSRIMAIPREGSLCDDILHRYETNAAAQKLNVVLSCEDNSTDDWVRSPKGYILTVTDYDRSKWSQETIQSEVERLLEPYREGPWTFQIEAIGDYLQE